MRIGFAGASGCGKSTLASWLAAELELPDNPVGSRSVAAAMGFASPYDVDAAGKRAEFQRRLLAEKLAWEAEHDAFVTDRTTFDNLAYTILHDARAVDEDQLRAAARGVRRLTYVFFCPLDAHQKTGDDPARVHDRAYHLVYEAVLRGLFLQFAPSVFFVELASGDLEERLKTVREVLDAPPDPMPF